MMFDEFEKFVGQEPELAESLNKAASSAARARPSTKAFDPVTVTAGMAALVILFPILNRIVRRIGLPWLKSAERYSELWRLEFERWLDEEYEKRGFDPAASRAASDALLQELETTTDDATRTAWERLLALLKKGQPKKDDTDENGTETD